jgi:hypothetical protein
VRTKEDPGRSGHDDRGSGIPTAVHGRSGPEPKATPLRRPSMTQWRVGKARPRPGLAERGPQSQPLVEGGGGRDHFKNVWRVGGLCHGAEKDPGSGADRGSS